MSANAGDPIARLLQGIDTPVDPRPEFAEALLQRLIDELGGTGQAGEPTARPVPLPATSPPALAQGAMPTAHPAWGRRFVVQAATLLLVLGSVLAALVLTRRQEPPVLIPAVASPLPAIEASPVTTPASTRSQPVSFRWRYDDPDGTRFALSPAITVAPDGTLWVVDGAEMGFQIFSREGELLQHWGSAGKGDGEFNFKVDAQNALGRVAFREDGSFYVADSQNRRVQQFAADRSFVRTWGSFGTGDGQFVKPIDVMVDAGGNVYVTDAARHDVQKFDADGTFLLRFGGRGDGDGLFNGPSWGAVAPDGTLWIADTGNNRLEQFSPDGAFLRAVGRAGSGPGEFNTPQGIAIDRDGRLYVTDSGNARVQVFSGDGAFLFALDGVDAGGTAFTWPIGVALDGQDRLYVHDYDVTEVVQQFQVAPAAITAEGSPMPP